MGRGKFGPPDGGPWPDDAWDGWWGEDPPFHMPVFVVTHHEREPLTLSDTTFTFVTDGIESALEQAKEAAGGKDVYIGGGSRASSTSTWRPASSTSSRSTSPAHARLAAPASSMASALT